MLIGVKTNEWAPILARQQDQISQLEAKVATFEDRAASLDALQARLEKLEALMVQAGSEVEAPASEQHVDRR